MNPLKKIHKTTTVYYIQFNTEFFRLDTCYDNDTKDNNIQ